jgi:hypothetical protein
MKTNKKYIFDHKILENPTAEFAYYLGWMWGDGTCRHKINTYKQSLEIQKEDGLEIVKFFESFCRPSKRFRHRIGRKPTMIISLYDQILGSFLKENGYEEKSQKPPIKILNYLPESLHEYWFRGFFEADGHASFREQTKKGYMLSIVEFYAPFNQNWDFLREYLFKSGIEIKTTTRQRPSGNSSCASMSKQDYVIKFINCVYSNKISMSLSRKHETLVEMKNYIVNSASSKSKKLQSKSS